VSDFQLARSSIREEKVRMGTKDAPGMDLGELRAALLAAADLSDDSMVTFEEIKSSVVEGQYFARVIEIRERSKVE
jgi:hypothetical protein